MVTSFLAVLVSKFSMRTASSSHGIYNHTKLKTGKQTWGVYSRVWYINKKVSEDRSLSLVC